MPSFSATRFELFLAARRFEPYDASHWTILLLFAFAAVALVVFARSRPQSPAPRILSRALAVFLLVWQTSFQIYSMLPPRWELAESLPFQLCDLAWMVCVYALWTDRPWANGLLFYWGLTLTSQALLTPNLEDGFPSVSFIMFWVSHGLVVLAAIFMTWGRGFRPTWRLYGLACTVTAAWMLVMMGFNRLAGTNYLFVSAKPDRKSILDLLGPWPWYVLAETAICVGVWALMTWPFARRRKSDR